MKHFTNLLSTFALLLLFIPNDISAQASGNILYNETTRWLAAPEVLPIKAGRPSHDELLIDVSALYNVQADSYLAIFHIVQMGATAAEADSLITKRIESFRKAMSAQGLPAKSIVPDMLSLVPVYEVEVTKKLFTKNYTEVPAGFEIQKNLHVHYTDAEMLDKIVTQAAIAEIYDLIKVDYYVQDHAAFYETLRAEAMKMVEKRISQLSKLGIPIEGQWRQSTDRQGIFFPLDRYVTYQPVVRTDISAIERRRRDEVETVTPQRRSTVYYKKLDYHEFDLIVNPEIIEPAVQYTYNLQVRILVERKQEVLPAPEPQIKVETQFRYLLVTPDGEIKELPAVN